MSNNSISIRLDEEYINFSNKLKKNRLKADSDEEILSHSNISKLIVKYFKLNNSSYLDLVNMKTD